MRIVSRGADDHVHEAIAIDITSTGNRSARVALRADRQRAIKAEPVATIEGLNLKISGKACRLAEHNVALSRAIPAGGGTGSPNNQSANPSPLTSPAEATEKPIRLRYCPPPTRKPTTPSSDCTEM